MVVYHFTSHEFYPRIEREGLTRGGVPWALIMNKQGESKVRMMKGVQWLTVDPEFDTQHWAFKSKGIVGSVIRKNDWRIAIDIPNLACGFLHKWEDFAAHHKLPVADAFRANIKGTQFWYVFTGKIPPNWFIEIIQNPTLRHLAEPFSN